MREKALKFGANRGLVGIVAEPAAPVAGKPAVVLLNSGILHHVGASRLYVQVARRLAAAGHVTLRFDFSGIGDSEPRRDTLGAAESAVVETREAMDLLQARKGGTDQFILFGLCSGADMGFKAAGVDERVVGLVQLDPFAYRTRGYYIHHYGPKLVNVNAWRHYVSVRVQRWRTSREKARVTSTMHDGEEIVSYVAPEYRRVFPPREETQAKLQALIARKVQMLNVFSSGMPDHYNHAEQYRASFPGLDFGSCLQVEFIRGAEHTFTFLPDQERLVDIVEQWATRVFPSIA
jgi:dienelactone hydrolase